jgi:hypothetical protein
MNTIQLFDSLPIWGIYLLTVLLAMLFVEMGYRLGRLRQKRTPADQAGKEGDTGSIVGATFGLMAFLVVFLIGIAINRFDNRRQLATGEAIATRTAYLRAGYLEEPYRTETRQLLLEYLEIRIAAATGAMPLAQAIVRSEEIHEELWARTEALARANPSVEIVALFIDSVNEVINLHTERVMAVALRIPPAIWTAIYAIIFLSLALLGFQNGLSGDRNFIAITIFVLVFAAVVVLLVDLDRPQEGLFRVSQQALIDLVEQMKQ